MVRNRFLPEVTRMRDSFFTEEIIFDRLFIDLEALQAENPGITESVYTEYFNKCSNYFGPMGKQLEGLPDKPARVGKILSEFRTRSSRCQIAFQQMKREFECLKNNLETYFELKYRFPKCS